MSHGVHDNPPRAFRLIIAGGRYYELTDTDRAQLDALHQFYHHSLEVVSGAAEGADAGGEAWARSRGIPVTRFEAEWDRYGKAAGPRRNQAMANYADGLAVFPGGRGTTNMIRNAEVRHLQIFYCGPWPQLYVRSL